MSAYGIETVFDILIPAVDLVDMVDTAGALCRHCSDKECDTGTYIG